MPRDRLLAASIFTLAAAVALHAVAPAAAQDDPAPAAQDEDDDAPRTRRRVTVEGDPTCRPIRLGTPREVSKVLGELKAQGHEQFMALGTGLVCGW